MKTINTGNITIRLAAISQFQAGEPPAAASNLPSWELKAPVKAKDLALEVYDREFFVDFSFAEKDPVKLVGAPAQCKLSIGRPQEMGASLTQQLSKLGADQRDPSLTIGAEYANKILVKCP